jgi:hypothetical protein
MQQILFLFKSDFMDCKGQGPYGVQKPELEKLLKKFQCG